MNESDFVRDVLDWCIVVGQYAEVVKSKAPSYLTKEGSHVFSRSLTSTDLSIERYFEVALLSKYPDLMFMGEEVERSLNYDFFPSEGKYLVSLDPINHTSYYQDGDDTYDVIVTLSDSGRIVGAVCYQPAHSRAFWALNGASYCFEGNYSPTEPWKRYEFKVPASKNSDLLTINDPELLSSLQSVCNPMDAIACYQSSGRTLGMSDTLTGEIKGFAKCHAHLRDWLAVAYIIEAAGGCVTDFSGSAVDWRFNEEFCMTELLVSSDQSFHSKLVKSLKS